MNVVEAAQFCDACGKAKHNDKDLLKCGRCRQAFYHDKKCQKNHWPMHKARCRQLLQLHQERQAELQNLKVLDTDDKGRVVVALKDFARGDIVLLESPAILFETRLGYQCLLEAFGMATVETQQKVLHLHAPPLEQIDSVARQQRHARLEQQRLAHLYQHPNQSSVLTAETTQKLLAIIETNAHELFNVSSNNNNDDKHKWMGLFCLGSMLEHSCNPNLTMNTTREGKLELLAESSITKGDRLSISYIEGIYEKSLQQRQALLLEEKHFLCHCARCQGMDECQPIQLQYYENNKKEEKAQLCEVCHTSHPVFWHAGHKKYICIISPEDNSNNNSPTSNNALSLQKDDSLVVEFFRVENELQQSITELEQAMERGTIPFQSVLKQLAALMTGSKWKFTIHSLHCLNVSACQLVSQVASAAARMQPSPQLDVESLLRLSVLALLHNLTWVEQTVRILRKPPASLREYVVAIQTEDNGNNNDDVPLPIQLMMILQSRLVNASTSNSNSNGQQQVIVPLDDLKHAVDIVCSTSSSSRPPVVDETSAVTADSLLMAFFTGQDLLLAGHADLCLLLYQHYQSWFHKLKQPNDENRARIHVFLESRGSVNPFQNLVL